MLYVKNTNSFRFKARYDGIDFDFPTNERVPISEDAARHIFGFGIEDKLEVMVKHGWCPSTDKIEDGKRTLNRFIFSTDEPAPTDTSIATDIPNFAERKKKIKAEMSQPATTE